MRKKRKIDFILHEDNVGKLIFRFYPRQSSCHSHNDEPPKSWDEVYKVYYNYAIIDQYIEKDKVVESRTMFYAHCDECSIIDGVGRKCKMIADGLKNTTITYEEKEYVVDLFQETQPFGMGVSWKITEGYYNKYRIELFCWDGNGYRFTIRQDKLKEFGEYLLECCEYMLAHGDPI